MAVALAAISTPAGAASGTWTNIAAGTIGYWTNSGNWSGASYPGTADGESAGINTASPNTYTCIVDTLIRYFPEYIQLSIRNSGGGDAWLVITNGGKLATYDGWIYPGGHVVVSGSNSQFGKHQGLSLGGGSNCSLRVENGASFFGQNSTFGVHVGGGIYGGNAGTNCSLVVTGAGSVFTNNMGAQQTQVGSGAGSVSNSVWILDGGRMVTTITLGSESSSLTINGAGSTFEGAVIMGGNNTLVTVGDGGILDANALDTSANISHVFTNSGGVYQFTTASPTIATNANADGSIFINGGTISFRNVSSGLNLTNNWSNPNFRKMTWAGANALRLNNSTAANTLAGGYLFDTGLGTTNYCRLEMISGTTAVTGNRIAIGANGSMLVRDTTATLSGALTNLGTLEVLSGKLTCNTNLALGAGSTTVVGLAETTNGFVNVLGTFTAGGTLVITNMTGFPWAFGQTWNLFDWTGDPVVFASLILPPLGGLQWDTKRLRTEGIITVGTGATLLFIR